VNFASELQGARSPLKTLVNHGISLTGESYDTTEVVSAISVSKTHLTRGLVSAILAKKKKKGASTHATAAAATQLWEVTTLDLRPLTSVEFLIELVPALRSQNLGAS